MCRPGAWFSSVKHLRYQREVEREAEKERTLSQNSFFNMKELPEMA